MSSFETSLKNALAANERQTCINTIVSAPNMSLADLAKEAKGAAGKLFSSITIGDLLNTHGIVLNGDAGEAPTAEPATEPRRRSATKRRKQGTSTRAAPPVIDTKSVEGRTAYDDALFQAVKAGNGLGSNAIREIAGGTPRQASAGLNRLIAEGRISWHGKARGTKYYIG